MSKLVYVGYLIILASFGRAAYVMWCSDGRLGRVGAGGYAVVAYWAGIRCASMLLGLSQDLATWAIIAVVAPMSAWLFWEMRPDRREIRSWFRWGP